MSKRREEMIHGITRREFLARGVTTASAALFLPQWIELLLGGARAHAADPICGTPDLSMIPFMTINLNGGAALQANYMPKLADGSMLSSYSKMGMGKIPTAIDKFGITGSFYSASKIIQGIEEVMARGTADNTTLTNTAFVAACVQSRDDTAENKLAVDGLLAKAGLLGSLLPNLGSVRNSTGVSHKSAYITPPAPLVVSNISDLVGAISFNNTIKSALNNTNDRSQLAKAIRRLSESQMRKIANSTKDTEVKDLIDCVGIKNISLTGQSSASPLDPNSDTTNATLLKAFWDDSGAGTATLPLDAAIAYSVLNKYAGSGIIEKSGYDYHDNTRTTGDARDLEAGRLIGKVLRTAAVLNKKIFLYVCTNGSVASTNSDSAGTNWISDFGLASCAYIFYYDPTGRKATSGSQIGNYTQGQIADPNFYSGASPELTATAIFANFMKLNNLMGTFETIVGSRFDTTQLDKLIKFE
jgi:hypothetical protein